MSSPLPTRLNPSNKVVTEFLGRLFLAVTDLPAVDDHIVFVGAVIDAAGSQRRNYRNASLPPRGTNSSPHVDCDWVSWVAEVIFRFAHERVAACPAEIQVERVIAEADHITLVVRVFRPVVQCPVCAQPSNRIHSYYERRLADLPWNGIPVEIRLRTRRFFCGTEDCAQRIFTERLPETTEAYARGDRLRGKHENVSGILYHNVDCRILRSFARPADRA